MAEPELFPASQTPTASEDAPQTHVELGAGETLCARVIGVSCRVQGVGTYSRGQLIPIDLHTACPVERALHLSPPQVEIVIGVPHYAPADPVSPDHVNPKAKAIFHIGERETVHKWAKSSVEKRAAQLLREKPSSYFVDKSPLEIASDEVFAKKQSVVIKERKRREDAVERLRAELPKRVDKLRAEAAEKVRQAKAAQVEAAKLGAAIANTGPALELAALRARVMQYAKITDNFTERPEIANDESSGKYLWNGRADLAAMRDLVHSAIRTNDVDVLRPIVDELDELYKAEPASELAAGMLDENGNQIRGYLKSVAPTFSFAVFPPQ